MKQFLIILLISLSSFQSEACDLETSQVKVNLQGQWVEIDSCLVDIIKSLNAAGIKTVSSCCGHGKSDGYILLDDPDRLLIVTPTGTGKQRYSKEFNGMAYQNMIGREKIKYQKEHNEN